MAKNVFVVTAPKVIETGEISYLFLIKSGAPSSCFDFESYGFVKLEPKGENELNPFKFVQGEPNAIGPDGKSMWRVFSGNGTGMNFSGSCEESEDDAGLQRLLRDVDDTAFLIAKNVFDRFEKACKAAGIALQVHHYDLPLSTSGARITQPVVS